MPSLRILGPLLLQGSDGEVRIGGDKPRRLLAALALYAGDTVSVDRLIDIIWDTRPPRSARENVQTYLWSLRRSLQASGPSIRIQVQAPGYLLQADPEELDWHCFTTMTSAARQCLGADPATAGKLLREALELWRGPVLADIADGLTPLRPRIDALEEARLEAVELRIQADLAVGRHGELVSELAELVATFPLRERLRAHQMTALYRCGRQSEALSAFRELRAQLADDLGIDPSPELRRLQETILLADPSLAPPAPEAATAGRASGAGSAAVPARRPRQLPARGGTFTGRDSELRQLDELLADHSSMLVAVICGPPGVGKSALAVHWAHTIQARFPDGTLYASLHGHDPDGIPAEATDVLDSFLRALGVPPDDIPGDEESRGALLRSTLDGRRALIVLDDAVSARQVRAILPGSPGCAVVITSRVRLSGLVARDGAVPVAIAPLTPAESLELLAQVIGAKRVSEAPDAAAEVASVCGGLPLALRIAADRAAMMPMPALADQLSDEHDRLAVLATEDDDTTVRAAFTQSYRWLDGPAAQAFRLLGLHPGQEFSLPAAAALAGSTVRQARSALGALLGAHLVEEGASDRLRMHDLLAVYAAERSLADETEPARRAATRRILAWYLHTADSAARQLIPQMLRPALGPVPARCHPLALADYQQALSWCETERANLVAAVRRAHAAGEHEVASTLPAVLSAYFMLSRRHRDWITTHDIGLASARCLGHRPAEARLLSSLGAAHGDLGQLDRAAACLQDALVIRSEIGDVAGQAATLLNLGHVQWELHRLDEGYGSWRRALDIFAACGDSYGQGMTLNNLGDACVDLGRYEEAQDYLRQARDIFRRDGDRPSEAMVLASLGRACGGQRRFEEAVSLLRESLVIRREVSDRHGEGLILTMIAETLHEMGDTEAARRTWRDALVIFDDLGDARADAVRIRLAAAGT